MRARESFGVSLGTEAQSLLMVINCQVVAQMPLSLCAGCLNITCCVVDTSGAAVDTGSEHRAATDVYGRLSVRELLGAVRANGARTSRKLFRSLTVC